MQSSVTEVHRLSNCGFLSTAPPGKSPSLFICFILKSLLKLLQYCFCLMFLGFGWEVCAILSSWQGSKCESHALCAGRQCLNHWTTREGPQIFFFEKNFFSKQFHCKHSARCIWLRNLIWDCLGSTPATPELISFLPSGNLLTLSKCHCPHLENRDFNSAYFMGLYEGLYEIST